MAARPTPARVPPGVLRDLADALGSTSETRACLLLVLTVLLVYLRAGAGSFQWDDFQVIVDNPGVHSLRAWAAGALRGLRPLLKLTYTLDWLGGLGAPGFHATNVALHALNACLVFGLGRSLLGRGPGALAGALLFALHPVQTEAVAYVCGRSMSLMATFSLGALLLHFRPVAAGRALARRVGAPLLFGLALLVRETALTLPLAALLLERVRGRSWGAALRALGPLGAVALLALGAGMLHPGYRHFLQDTVALRGLLSTLLTQVEAWAYLASRLVLPGSLNLDPDLAVVAATSPGGLLGLGLLGAAILLALGRLGPGRFGALAVAWFALHLMPTNSVLPRLDVASERHLYLALAGVALAAGAALQGIPRDRQGLRSSLAVAGFGLLLALGLMTHQRNGAYASEIALWEDTARKSPLKARVHSNLGFAYQQAGLLEAARRAYLRALALDPAWHPAAANLATLGLDREGRPLPGEATDANQGKR